MFGTIQSNWIQPYCQTYPYIECCLLCKYLAPIVEVELRRRFLCEPRFRSLKFLPSNFDVR